MNEAPLILVVDDEQSYRDALRVALEREGFRVEVAADGVEALERFESARPSLVLLDLMLPKLSGVDIVDDRHGLWRCHFAGSCSKVCPKGVDPALGIQLLRSYMLGISKDNRKG